MCPVQQTTCDNEAVQWTTWPTSHKLTHTHAQGSKKHEIKPQHGHYIFPSDTNQNDPCPICSWPFKKNMCEVEHARAHCHALPRTYTNKHYVHVVQVVRVWDVEAFVTNLVRNPTILQVRLFSRTPSLGFIFCRVQAFKHARKLRLETHVPGFVTGALDGDNYKDFDPARQGKFSGLAEDGTPAGICFQMSSDPTETFHDVCAITISTPSRT